MTSTIEQARTHSRIRTLRVGMLGLGTVGEALCRLVRSRRNELARRHGVRIEMAAALVRDTTRERAHRPDAVTADAREFMGGDYDCVVDAMGGTEPAGAYVAQLLRRGIPVVSANKALLAERGTVLAGLGAPLFAEASVAAGIPLLSMLDRSLQTTRIDTVTAILNGTSNFVLTRIARTGASLGAAVEEAHRAGFVETDPTLDLNGTDAAQKLSLLVGHLGRHALPVDSIERDGIASVRAEDVRRAAAFGYTRTNNPTRRTLEEVLAALEGAAECAVFASGIAAENALLQALLKPGDEVLVANDLYGGTYRLLHDVYVPKGYSVVTDGEYVRFSERTKIVWIESPTNPRLQTCDIVAIAARAHARGAIVVVDNTFASPINQKPFELGADLVVHSVTKYLAGHSDVIQGAVLARDPELFAPIRHLQNATGAVPSPFDCWLTLRGLKTPTLRVRQHNKNGAAVARFLEAHPAVARVYYPGFGGVVSEELAATVRETKRFVSERRFFKLAESLGGVKSLICHPATMTHAAIPPSERARLGLSDTLVRLACGIEHPEDLIEDLREGLRHFDAELHREHAIKG